MGCFLLLSLQSTMHSKKACTSTVSGREPEVVVHVRVSMTHARQPSQLFALDTMPSGVHAVLLSVVLVYMLYLQATKKNNPQG